MLSLGDALLAVVCGARTEAASELEERLQLDLAETDLGLELQQRGNEEHHVLKVRSHLLGRLANIHVGQEALVAALLLRIPLVQLAVPILLAVLEASNLSTIVESNAHRHRVVGVDACVDVLHEPQNE